MSVLVLVCATHTVGASLAAAGSNADDPQSLQLMEQGVVLLVVARTLVAAALSARNSMGAVGARAALGLRRRRLK